MKFVYLLGVFALIAVSSCAANDLRVGSNYPYRLVWDHQAEYRGIPFKKRVKEVFYSNPNQQVIRGILASDAKHSSGSATIIAGGVGFPYVNLRLKSERGKGLDYHIQIYA